MRGRYKSAAGVFFEAPRVASMRLASHFHIADASNINALMFAQLGFMRYKHGEGLRKSDRYQSWRTL
jgi:hypothetical protein